jgi:ankyrin repeat protein
MKCTGYNTTCNPFQTTALIPAAKYGRLEVARLLLDAGADPSADLITFSV